MPTKAQFQLESDSAQRLKIVLSGDWIATAARPSTDEIVRRLTADEKLKEIVWLADQLGHWDSLLLTFLANVNAACESAGIRINDQALPTGVRGMLGLAGAVDEPTGVGRPPLRDSWLSAVGRLGIAFWDDAVAMMTFIGEAALSFGRFLTGRAYFRPVDFWLLLQECGVNALPIVSLISILVGMILAFVGSVQLSNYGAQAYIADMVGLGMAREMGALMTAIIMTGRTGAAFASQLGSMQVNDEIDALKTMGFSEMDFLVMPRMMALILMMPLLCVYADLMGMIGGAIASISLFDSTALEYAQHIRIRLNFRDFAVGIGKSAVFGVLVAISGCLRGLQCGRSSQAVGLSATSAVVTGIVMIICADAVMTLIVTTLHW